MGNHSSTPCAGSPAAKQGETGLAVRTKRETRALARARVHADIQRRLKKGEAGLRRLRRLPNRWFSLKMQKLEQEVRMLRAEEEAIIREYAREARHERDQHPPASPATRQDRDVEDLDSVLAQATSGMNGEWRSYGRSENAIDVDHVNAIDIDRESLEEFTLVVRSDGCVTGYPTFPGRREDAFTLTGIVKAESRESIYLEMTQTYPHTGNETNWMARVDPDGTTLRGKWTGSFAGCFRAERHGKLGKRVDVGRNGQTRNQVHELPVSGIDAPQRRLHDNAAAAERARRARADKQARAKAEQVQAAQARAEEHARAKAEIARRKERAETALREIEQRRLAQAVQERAQSRARSPGSRSPRSRQKRRSDPDTRPSSPGYVAEPADYTECDARASSMSVRQCSVSNLTKRLTEGIRNDEMSARVIFRWIAGNIAYDVANKQQKTADEALRTRSAVCSGYSALFKEMCEAAGIQCEQISGLSKDADGSCEEPHKYKTMHSYINDTGVTTQVTTHHSNGGHSWNAIRINGEWKLCDVCWAAGAVSTGGRWTKRFDKTWWCTAPQHFVEKHLPEDPKWQLLDRSLSKEEWKRRRLSTKWAPTTFAGMNDGDEVLSPPEGVVRSGRMVEFSIFLKEQSPSTLRLQWDKSWGETLKPTRRSGGYVHRIRTSGEGHQVKIMREGKTTRTETSTAWLTNTAYEGLAAWKVE